jgi:hypothetical protein
MVLRAGRSIVPPPYVGGTWHLTLARDSACPESPAPDTLTMLVSQSGPMVTMTLKNASGLKLRGRTYGTHFRVAGQKVNVHAAVKKGENRMRAIFVGYPCAASRRTVAYGDRVLPPSQSENH